MDASTIIMVVGAILIYSGLGLSLYAFVYDASITEEQWCNWFAGYIFVMLFSFTTLAFGLPFIL